MDHSVTIRVSKQRPSKRQPNSPRGAIASARALESDAFWRRRVFRNTYTRKGRAIRVKKWSVKIQHRGRRRTFSLAAPSRPEAAREAQFLYRLIRAKGWDACTRDYARPGSSSV